MTPEQYRDKFHYPLDNFEAYTSDVQEIVDNHRPLFDRMMQSFGIEAKFDIRESRYSSGAEKAKRIVAVDRIMGATWRAKMHPLRPWLR